MRRGDRLWAAKKNRRETRVGTPIATERRMLTEAEFAAVAQTHYPEIC